MNLKLLLFTYLIVIIVKRFGDFTAGEEFPYGELLDGSAVHSIHPQSLPLSPPKGMRDFGSEEMRKRQFI